MSARKKQHCRKHTGGSSLSRKDLKSKNCCGSAAMEVTKLDAWERSILFCNYTHQQRYLWISHPLGQAGCAHQEGWLTPQSQGWRESSGVRDCLARSRLPHCPQQALSAECSLQLGPPSSERYLFSLSPSFHSSCGALHTFVTSPVS